MQNIKESHKRELSLAIFKQKQICFNDTIINVNGFELKKNNNRAKDFFRNYINMQDNKLLSFQIKRYSNQANTYIMNQNTKDFIVVEYFEEGQFLDQINEITFLSFQNIFLQLIQFVYYLHKEEKILARCITSKNIYYEKFEDKIFLFEFGFSPDCPYKQIYKPNIDIKLIIDIMNDVYKKKKDSIDQFSEFKKKMDILEEQLPTIDVIESYLRMYQLAEGNFPQDEVKSVYTKKWVSDMTEKIQKDFLPPREIEFDNNSDSEQTDSEQKTPSELLELTIKIFENGYPNYQDQIGLMLLRLYILNQQTYQKQQVNEKQIQINKKRSQIYSNYQHIPEEVRYIIKPDQNDDNPERQKEFKGIYQKYTFATFKRLFEDKMNTYKEIQQIEFTFQEARICFMLVASIDMFRSKGIEKIYKTKEIEDKIKMCLEILQLHYPKKKNEV